MALRLSELLDRIRPAGAPGSPAEGDQQRQDADRAREVAAVTALLLTFEGEADTILDAARAEADRQRGRGRHRARELQASLPDRLAVARSGQPADDGGEGDGNKIRLQATREIPRLEAQAEAAIPQLVDRTVELIWSSFLLDGPET